MVDCPYLTKSGKQNWLTGAVLPWLDNMDMAHAERESRSDLIKDAIFDFASKPIWHETFKGAFNQTREPVREEQDSVPAIQRPTDICEENNGSGYR